MKRQSDIIPIDDAPTLAATFQARTERTPDVPAYRDWDSETRQWRSYSWREIGEQVRRWQAALHRFGLQRGDRVAVMAPNSHHWAVFDHAALGLGLVTVPIYTNDRGENIAWMLHDSGARLLLIQGPEQWDRIMALPPRLDHLERIVSLRPVPGADPIVQTAAHFLKKGTDPDFEADVAAIDKDALASIVYTSGTTGRPKGVMLSHYNMLWNAHAGLARFEIFPDDLFLSFLPLSHTLERTVGYYLPLIAGTEVAYNRAINLIADDLAEIRPTILISVPRIFEKVRNKLSTKLAEESFIKRGLFHAAVSIGWRRFLHRQGRGVWSPSHWLGALLDRLVGAKVRARLGGRVRLAVVGGAALEPEISRTFIGLGLNMVQGYGLTEASPVISVNLTDRNEPHTVGPALPGVEVRVGDQDELLTRGPAVMRGYWRNVEATRAVIDPDGWLRTGDRARIDLRGHIHIVGRLKEIIVLSNGEKVPPTDIENAIALDHLFDQVVLVGEGRPYLTALVVPNAAGFDKVAHELHLDPANEATCCDRQLRSLYLEHVQQQLSRFPGYAKVRDLAVIREHWTPDNGLATPTLKLRRDQILERYRRQTEELYRKRA